MLKALSFILLLSSFAYATELPLKSKEVIFEAITRDMYFEDEGYSRMPKSIDDFTYTIMEKDLIKVEGFSYSDWDMKEIFYACTVKVLTRGMIEKMEDVDVRCKLEGENWPYAN
jgi:hypothetical protein